MSFQNDVAKKVAIFRIEKDIYDMVDHYMQGILREEIKKLVETDEVRQAICTEIEKVFARNDSRNAISVMISEVVSETIKTTILQLKEQGIL